MKLEILIALILFVTLPARGATTAVRNGPACELLRRFGLILPAKTNLQFNEPVLMIVHGSETFDKTGTAKEGIDFLMKWAQKNERPSVALTNDSGKSWYPETLDFDHTVRSNFGSHTITAPVAILAGGHYGYCLQNALIDLVAGGTSEIHIPAFATYYPISNKRGVVVKAGNLADRFISGDLKTEAEQKADFESQARNIFALTSQKGPTRIEFQVDGKKVATFARPNGNQSDTKVRMVTIRIWTTESSFQGI